MQSLGYSRTWVTTCFINGGCGAKVFAHTSGSGDFVLLDQLGWPWPVHDCYLNRDSTGTSDLSPRPAGASPILSIAAGRTAGQQERQPAIRSGVVPSARNPIPAGITRVEPSASMGRTVMTVEGIVADFREQHRPKELRGLGTLGEQIVAKIIGTRRSQITITTARRQSFTALVDSRYEVVGKGDTVTAELRVVLILTSAVFLCDQLRRLPLAKQP